MYIRFIHGFSNDDGSGKSLKEGRTDLFNLELSESSTTTETLSPSIETTASVSNNNSYLLSVILIPLACVILFVLLIVYCLKLKKNKNEANAIVH
jgi:hypothetical protein